MHAPIKTFFDRLYSQFDTSLPHSLRPSPFALASSPPRFDFSIFRRFSSVPHNDTSEKVLSKRTHLKVSLQCQGRDKLTKFAITRSGRTIARCPIPENGRRWAGSVI
jgi:hypothetical protein